MFFITIHVLRSDEERYEKFKLNIANHVQASKTQSWKIWFRENWRSFPFEAVNQGTLLASLICEDYSDRLVGGYSAEHLTTKC